MATLVLVVVIPVVFVICNNSQYQILKICGHVLSLPQAQAGNFEGMDLVAPEIDYVSLARLHEAGDLLEAVRAASAGLLDEKRAALQAILAGRSEVLG